MTPAFLAARKKRLGKLMAANHNFHDNEEKRRRRDARLKDADMDGRY